MKKQTRYLNRHLTKEGVQAANKRRSMSRVIMEMQIKTSMGYESTPIRNSPNPEP